ncbi:MAG: signal peptide peptidase SppA [Muribaculaceae bacterium]|nr:signal peptide peptidase SppA [Muribaculaceae bacterium]
MLKRFFTIFLGSMAAIWLSAGVLVLLFFMMIAAASQMGGSKSKPEVKNNSVLVLDLSGQIEERLTPTTLLDAIYGYDETRAGLNNITGAIRCAAKDKRIAGIYIKAKGSSAGTATCQSIVEELNRFKAEGKWIVAYGDSYTQGDYMISSMADDILINPEGSVDIHGLGGQVLFFTGLLEKLGVEMQVIRVGTFKSAVEPFMLKEMSAANREQTQAYIDGIWGEVRDIIANNRPQLTSDEINVLADSMVMTVSVDELMTLGVVDNKVYERTVDDFIAGKIDGVEKGKDVSYIGVDDYCSAVNTLNPEKWSDDKRVDKNEIAILYAMGDIVDSGDEGIVGEAMVKEITELADNDNVKGLILRVNSGGGSAFASEQIWEALEYFKSKDKKFYASMGDVAASGGYYISCGADSIYAQPTTITGSIGIFGLIPNINGLVTDKLGVTMSGVGSNANSDFPTIMKPMTSYQRACMQKMINRGYETFTGRCAAGRHMDIDSIKAIAEGRVWYGAKAKDLGLVDVLGGLDKAVADMAAAIGGEGYSIGEYPDLEMNWWDELMNIDKSMKMRAMREAAGDAWPLYHAAQQIKNMAPIQCRMETVVVE